MLYFLLNLYKYCLFRNNYEQVYLKIELFWKKLKRSKLFKKKHIYNKYVKRLVWKIDIF